jgi:hypothetical protein
VSGAAFSLPGRPALPLDLAPGQRRGLRVRFTPGESRLLPFDGSLRVVSDDPAEPVREVGLTGLSLPGALRVAPRRYDFGAVPAGQGRTVTLTLRTTDECPVPLGGTRLSGSLWWTLQPGRLPVRVDPGETETLSVRLRCSGQDDLLEATLRVLDEAGRSVGSAQLLGYCDRER